MSVPITPGSGASSVAAQLVAGLNYQQVQIYGPGGASVLAPNPDGSFNASIIGTPSFSLGASSVIVAGRPSVSGSVNVSSLLSIPGIVSTVNSTTATLGGGAVFTGTSEEVKDFGSIVISVFTDQVSATDGLSIQQSSDATNWDITDTYTISASSGKTIQVQPAARFLRVVYTNGATPQGAFRLQTIYHPQLVKPTSQRPADNYTNETDTEQNQTFTMVYNGTNWDRLRGNSSIGVLVSTGSSSVITRDTITSIATAGGVLPIAGSVAAFQAGTQVTSLVSTVPSSVIVGASIFGQLPGGTAVLGSVAALQGTNPWVSTNVGSIITISAGSIITVLQTSSLIAISTGSVVTVPSGSVITVFQAPSIVGTYAEDAASASGDKGFLVMGARNDTLSSVTSNDGDYSSHVVGPAGELIAENAPLTKWVSGTGSMLGGVPLTSSVAVIAAQGASIFTYVTGVQVANFGAASVLVSFFGATSSLIGYTIAPAGGGSNIYYQNGIKTSANGAFSASVSGTASIYVAAQGFISKT